MNTKTLVLVMAIIFLLTQSGCATVNKSQMQPNAAYTGDTIRDRDAQLKKDATEWWIVALVVLGIAIAVGATVAISSGGGGFSAGVNK